MTDWYVLEVDAMALSTRQASSGQGVRAYLQVSPEDALQAILRLVEAGLDVGEFLTTYERKEAW